jgi:hypothetical protein
MNALITADKLYNACQSSNDEDQGVCLGYVMGIADALSSPNGLFGLSACTNKGVKVGELRDIVMKFLENHEAKRRFAAATGLTEALSERFPCKAHHFDAEDYMVDDRKAPMSAQDQADQLLDSIDPGVSGWGPSKALDGTD